MDIRPTGVERHWLHELARRFRGSSHRSMFARSARLPVAKGELVVIEDDGSAMRVVLVNVGSADELNLTASRSVPAARGRTSALAKLLDEVGASPERALVVSTAAHASIRTHELRRDLARAEPMIAPPRPDAGDAELCLGWTTRSPEHESAPMQTMLVSLPRRERELWLASCEELGIALEGIYAPEGTAVAGLRWNDDDLPALCLQVEPTSTSLIEVSARGSVAIDTFRGEPPSIRRCLQLVGEGCTELFVCGGGVELSSFGCELVHQGTSWVRFPEVRARTPEGLPADPSLAAAVGASRHALGLVRRDALPCVPPSD